jgi:hypothetical protein
MYSPVLETAWRSLAPGACAALAAAALAWSLARWYDRVPRRVLALFALVLVAFFGRVLLAGDVLLPLDNLRGEPPFRALPPAEPHGNVLQGDLIYLVEPLRSEVRRSVEAGAWPLWAPRLGAGQPLLANPQAQALQPLAAGGLVVARVADPLTAAGAVAALRVFVALVFAFLLLRRLGAGTGPATAGALAYGLGGFLQLWLGWPIANAAAWLPAVLYAVARTEEEGGRRDVVLLVAALFCLLTAGHPQAIVLSLAVAGGVAALRLAGTDQIAAGGRRAFAVRSAGALALALLLAAPALLPFAAWMPETLRWSRSGEAAAPGPAAVDTVGGVSERPAPPATRVLQAVAPNALGNSRYAAYWGVANSNEDAAGFVGTATLLAALLALPLVLVRRRPGDGGLAHERAAAVLAAGCLAVLAVSGNGVFGVGGRIALPLNLAMAVLAAAALERFRRGTVPRWLVFGVLPAVGVALAAFHFWVVPAFSLPAEPSTLEVLRVGWRHWHLRFLAAAAALLLVSGTLFPEGLGKGRRRLPVAAGGRFALREVTVAAVALLVAAELWLAHAPVNPPMPRSLTEDGGFPETPALRAVLDAAEEDGGPVRVAAGGRVLLPNLASVYGLGDARIYDPTAPAAYLRMLAPGIERWSGEIPLLAPEEGGGARTELYDRLGIAWWLSAPEVPCPPGTAEVALDTDGDAAAAARLCRRPGARALVRAVPTGGGEARAGMGPAGDHWSIEREPAAAGRGEPWRVETAIFHAPGWRVVARGDGATRPARRTSTRETPAAGDVLLAAELPAGTRRADLLFRPAPFVAGCLLAALGLGMAITGLAQPPSASR